jgi:hypothetical protein
MKEIDNCESFTYVNSEAAMEQIQLITIQYGLVVKPNLDI